jgi:hypothetical protein
MSVIPFSAPGPGDSTTQKYLQLATTEQADLRKRITNLSDEISQKQTQLSAMQATDAELTRMIADLQNP